MDENKSKFGKIEFELIGGRKNLEDIMNSIQNREIFLRDKGEKVKKIAGYEQGNENKEVYHIDKTTLTINYSGKNIPISIYGDFEKIKENYDLYEKLIGSKLIPTGSFYDYTKLRPGIALNEKYRN